MPFALRPVALVTGMVLVVLAIAMMLPALTDVCHGDADWRAFFASAMAILFAGLALLATNRGEFGVVSRRQLVALTVCSWGTAILAASLPFAASTLGLSPTDAVFEAASGITSTGSTVLRRLDAVPPGILLWRALLQWLGGAGFLVNAVIILPELDIGGMQIFRLESTGLGQGGMPRSAIKMARDLVGIYAMLTAFLVLLLWVAGMSRFPALLHAMSTISCGGFSTADTSVGAWRNPGVDWVILLGMILGGAPFAIYLDLARKRWRDACSNEQLRWYLSVLFFATLALAAWLLLEKNVKPLPSLRHGAFAVVSVMTGTGYATLDFGRWDGLPEAMLFFLSFVGGCAGSTAGGLKVFRVQILLTTAHQMLVRLLRPNIVQLTKYQGRPVSERIAESVLGYLFIYLMSFAFLALALGLLGLDFMSSTSVAISSLANLGPGLTQAVGPMASYADLPEAAKWLLSAAMMFGRLEMLPVLVLFVPSFWEP